jgi:acyl carrier protein
VREQVRRFIIDTFLYGEGTVQDDQPLFDSGIIDSLGFVKLLAFLEATCQVSMDMSEVGMESFNTLDEIVKTIEAKRKA